MRTIVSKKTSKKPIIISRLSLPTKRISYVDSSLNQRRLDVLREKVLQIKANPNLILDEYYMMKIFDEFLYLTPFAEYLEFMFTKRRMSVVARRSGAKVMHMQLARSELFNPTNETNIDTTTRVVELGTVAKTTLLREFHDPKKASH